MAFEITPQLNDIELNIIPLDLLVTDEERVTAMTIGSTPATNVSSLVNPVIATNIIKTGGGSIVKGFLKSNNYSVGIYGWIIKGDGTAEFTDGTFVGTITATSGAIGGWIIGSTFIADNATAANAKILLDSANTLIRIGVAGGDNIVIDGANQRIRSSNYSTGVSGFTIEPGLIEAQNIRARGILQSAVFQKDTISAIGGQLLVANADALDADMTAADNSTLTIKGDTTLVLNSILRIKDGTDDEYLRVTNVGSAPTYTVTRDLGSDYSSDNNPAWKKGQAVVVQGLSDGGSTFSGGWLQLFGEGTNSPYYSVFKRTGVAFDAFTEIVRIGNLNGFLDYSSEEYGIAMGTSSDFVKIDTTNGVNISGYVISSKGTFGGDGSDGTIPDGATINASGVKVVTKNYTNGTLGISNTLTISNPHSQGTILHLKFTGDVIINGTINMAEMGANGGAGRTAISGSPGVTGSEMNYVWNSDTHGGTGGDSDGAGGNSGGGGGGGAHRNGGTDGGNGAGGNNGGASGTAVTNFDAFVNPNVFSMIRGISGAGGGGGGSATADGGNAGKGGGVIIIECRGNLTFGGSSTLTVEGQDGTAGGDNINPGGGGGGGSGGQIIVLYNGNLTDNGVTKTISGGSGGAGGSGGPGGGGGGNGGDGDELVEKNISLS